MIVLVVDDSKLIRQIIRNNLENLNIPSRDIHEAIDGQEALRKINTLKKIDLIITDLQMPNIDGLEFVKRIRGNRNFQTTRVVAISSQLTPQVKLLFERLNVNDFIDKPFDLEKFMTLIKPIVNEIKGVDKTLDITDLKNEILKSAQEIQPIIKVTEEMVHIELKEIVLHIATETLLKYATIERKKENIT